MDCIFNCFIPDPTDDTMVLRPAGKTYINGMCEAYRGNYEDIKLKGVLTLSEFNGIVDRINDSILNEYPCPGCQLFGYCCCPCTLGLSFILPVRKCLAAEKACRSQLDRLNSHLKEKKLYFQFIREKSTSYILIFLPNHQRWAPKKEGEKMGPAQQ